MAVIHILNMANLEKRRIPLVMGPRTKRLEMNIPRREWEANAINVTTS